VCLLKFISDDLFPADNLSIEEGRFQFVAQKSLTHFALFLNGGGVQYEAYEQAAL
jgi:hypothetical protein